MFKRLFMIALIGAAGIAAWQATHPAPVSADGATPTIAADASDSFMGRMKVRVGVMTTKVAGGQIRASVAKTENDLVLLGPAIKRTQGAGQKRALAVSKKIAALDSLSLAALDQNHPVSAIKIAMNARGYIDLIKQDVYEATAR